jgi:hypothetical protein
VLILALTCTVAAAVRARRRRPRRHVRPADTGCGRLLAAVCAKYVPKFQAATLTPGGAHARRACASPATAATTPAGHEYRWGATAARSVADEYVAGLPYPAALGAGLGPSGCGPRCAEQGDLCAPPVSPTPPTTHSHAELSALCCRIFMHNWAWSFGTGKSGRGIRPAA